MTLLDGPAPPGYRYIGPDKRAGQWGQFVLGDGDGDPNIAAELEKRQREREASEREALARSLPIPDRDRGYRRLASELGLAKCDRDSLLARGFEGSDLDRLPFFSVGKYQRVPCGLPDGFPGVADGKILVAGDGFACPVPTPDGLIAGWQFRLHDPGDGGKYRWAKNAKLSIGEMPMGYHRPNEQTANYIGLCESPSIKPALAAKKLGTIVLGAASANFSASPQQFKEYLSKASEETGSKTVVLFPDGGMLDKKHKTVRKCYARALKLAKKWGYSVKIAWWNQWNKADGDIDEIGSEAIANIEHIEPSRYFTHLLNQYANRTKNERATVNGAKAENQEFLEDDSSQEVAASLLVERNIYDDLSSLGDYEPNIRLNCERLPEDLYQLVPQSGIAWLYSIYASGKSKAVIGPVIERAKNEGKTVLSVAVRISIGREQSTKFDITWIDEFGQKHSTCGVCFDSLLKVVNRHWDVIIIDEARAGVKHLLTGNTHIGKIRPQVLKAFRGVIGDTLNNGGLLLLADADLTHVEIDYVRQFAPSAPVFGILNEHTGPSFPIDFYREKRGTLQSRLMQSISSAIVSPLNRGQDPEPILVCADSQKELEALHREIIKKFPQLSERVCRVDSKTSTEEFAKQFCANPNRFIEQTRPLVMLYSPTVFVGVSIEIEWFAYLVSFYFGTLEPVEFTQLCKRYRPIVPTAIWASDTTTNWDGINSCNPKEVKSILAAKLHESHQATNEVIALLRAESSSAVELGEKIMALGKGEYSSPHLDAWCKIKARDNYTKYRRADILKEHLEDRVNARLQIKMGEATTETEANKQQRQAIKAEEAQALSDAALSDMTIEEAQAILDDPSTSYKERIEAHGVMLRERYQGVQWTPDMCLFSIVDNPTFLSSQSRFYWLHNLEKLRLREAKHIAKHEKKWLEGDVFLPDINAEFPRLQCLARWGFLDIIAALEAGEELNASSDVIVKAFDAMKRDKKSLKRHFNITIKPPKKRKKRQHKGGTSPIALTNRMLRWLGVPIKVRKLSDGSRLYSLNSEFYYSPHRCSIQVALKTRHESALGFNKDDYPQDMNWGACRLSLKYYREQFEIARGIDSQPVSDPEPVPPPLPPPDPVPPPIPPPSPPQERWLSIPENCPIRWLASVRDRLIKEGHDLVRLTGKTLWIPRSDGCGERPEKLRPNEFAALTST